MGKQIPKSRGSSHALTSMTPKREAINIQTNLTEYLSEPLFFAILALLGNDWSIR